MATISNAMAGSTVQPKWFHVGDQAIVCTQAIASAAASAQAYQLFSVGSGMTILKAFGRLSAAVGTATNSVFHVGIATNGGTIISSAISTATYPQYNGAACTLPYSCTADTPIYAWIGEAANAAANLYVTLFVAATETID